MIPYYILAIEDDSDRAFMEAVFVEYNRVIYHRLLKRVGKHWEAEDLMQDIMVRLIENLKTVRQKDRDGLAGYIAVACDNHAANYWRYIKRHPSVELDEKYGMTDDSHDQAAIERYIIQESEKACFSRVWGTLDERTRSILEGHYILNLSNEELAEQLEIQPDSIRMTLFRERRKAFARLQKAYENGE